MINNRPENGPAPSSGVALVLVLAFLVLITVFVVAFFSSVTTERATSKDYANQISTKQLADSAVNLVMAQIVDATTGTNAVSRLAWASQPGMIRTYDVTGTDAGFYKLYSSKNMVTHQAQLAADLAADVPANWYSMPAFYTDLNSPVLVSDTGGGIVPNSSAPGDKYTAEYPILNPLAQAPNPDLPSTGQAEGFSISGTSVGYAGSNPPAANYNPTPVTGGSKTPNPAAMPTQWLYVLQDGTVTAPDGAGANGTIATWSGSNSVAPTTPNPIVGRIAFWTDDETSKININTAGGDQQNRAGAGSTAFVGQPATSPGGSDSPGSFWDIPRTESAEDQNLAECQLVQGEYQRYPGHPSTVALSTLFPSLTRDQIIALAPRLSSSNSSEGGTVFTSTNSVSTPAPMTFALNRLYASTDELFFQPGTSGGYRLPNTTGTASTSSSIVDQYRFFLTAHSRAPETNLFNLPRITIWPITTAAAAQTSSTTYQTASDSLIAFCSTTGTNPFYSTRYDPTSMTNDYAQIPRNQALYSYLQWLTGQQIPGVANTVLGTSCPANGFLAKYPSAGGVGVTERDQILTEIFDYIRSEINLQDSELIANGGTPYTPLASASGTAGNMQLGSGQVVPIRIVTASGTTQGFGRFPTIAEAAIVWISTTLYSGSNSYTDSSFTMQPILLFETYNVSQGFATYRPSLQHVVTVTQPCSVTVGGTTTQLDFATSGTNQISGIAGDYSESWGGVEGIASPLFYNIIYPPQVKTAPGGYGTVKTIPATRTTQNDPVTAYPFYSSQIPLLSNTTFNFSGGEFSLAIKTMKGETVQTIDLQFPPTNNIPAPRPVPSGENVSGAYASSDTWQLRFNGVKQVGGGAANTLLLSCSIPNITQPTTIRAIEPAGQKAQGDYRIIAATPNVTGTSYFLPHLLYNGGSTQPFAHSLRFAYQGETYSGYTYGNLVTSTTYNNSGYPISTPDFPSSVSSGAVINTASGPIPGDWDNGMADMSDGAYINKADEGSILNAQSTMVNGNENAAYFAGGEFANVPYYAGGQQISTTFHSPNRQVASAVMFGSLSTGVIRGLPWQTLLFHPDPSGGEHPGSAQPKDYYLLDLFNMPVVEPYAISEPFSTAGKINMNYQIVPFTYIKRTTAIRAVLDSTLTMAIPNTSGNVYKSQGDGTNATDIPKMHYRHPIDPDATLVQWDNRFANNDIFHSAAEVCDQELVPKADGLLISGSLTAAGMPAFWAKNLLTGANTRDMPYNHIYPLLTTKSNTYTVHFRVQSLLKPSSDHNPAQWTEGTDKVTGEYRGSTIIERYIDASDPNLPDFATNHTATMDAYYKFRVIGTKRFEP